MSAAVFFALAVLVLAGAMAAATLQKLIHAALSLVATFVGIAAFFFLLGAEFVGLVQVFVYIGAVAVLVVFTILLTRREGTPQEGFKWSGAVLACIVFAALLWVVFKTPSLHLVAPPIEQPTVKQIGEVLLTNYVWPLQCVGLLLTAAMIGAIILTMEEKP